MRWPSRVPAARSSSGPRPTCARARPPACAFLGMANYNQNPAAFNSAIQISTPLTVDAKGNLYFGYISSGAALPGYPNGVPSGLARLDAERRRLVRLGEPAQRRCQHDSKVTINCARRSSNDGKYVYVAVNKYDLLRRLSLPGHGRRHAQPHGEGLPEGSQHRRRRA